MKLPRRKLLHIAASAAALAAVSQIAGAQSYPTRPITMIVSFPAGGARTRSAVYSPRICGSRPVNL
jgi:hypothetical protein